MKKSNAMEGLQKADNVKLVFQQLLSSAAEQKVFTPQREKGLAFAPTNIALCKYWGKRDIELNLPITSSLSISIPDKGAMTTITLHDAQHDKVILNKEEIARDSIFFTRIVDFLDLFRPQKQWRLQIEIAMNLPVAAGFASSACGFASLVAALNDLFAWELPMRSLSILARLGSGSAARSFWPGFVEWHAGTQSDGMDSYAEPLDFEWPGLCLGILAIDQRPKAISSTEAMVRTVNSSVLYGSWPKKVAQDMALLKQAIKIKNFGLLGGTVESNALAMHATMLTSWPPICYTQPQTLAAMQQIWELRQQGVSLFFTQDAGPNLKLLFLSHDLAQVKNYFRDLDSVELFP